MVLTAELLHHLVATGHIAVGSHGLQLRGLIEIEECKAGE